MLVSPAPRIPRWLHAAITVLALATLPLGAAAAQEPDYEAVGDRLLEAVEEGELTAEQAEAMMGKLAKTRFKERLLAERADDEPHSHGHRGHHDDDHDDHDGHDGHDDHDGHDEERELLKGFAKAGVSEETLERIVHYFEESGIKDEKLERTLPVLLKAIWVLRKKGDLGEDFVDYFKHEVGLRDGQIKAVFDVARKFAHTASKGDAEQAEGKKGGDRLARHFGAFGVKEETVAKVREHLVNKGFEEAQLPPALGAMLRSMYALKTSDGEQKEMSDELRKFLATRGRLKKEQIDLVQQLALRLYHGHKDQAPVTKKRKGKKKAKKRKGKKKSKKAKKKAKKKSKKKSADKRDASIDEHFEALGVNAEILGRIRSALSEGGLDKKKVEHALGAVLRLGHAFSKDADYKPDDKIEAYLRKELGLNDDQVERVLRISQHVGKIARR